MTTHAKTLEALRNAADVLEEAATYTSSESWSPSMTEECQRAERMCRAALAEAATVAAAPAVPAQVVEAETFAQKTERNIRVQARYDELMRAGKHGHYETLFRVVREEVEAARAALTAQPAATTLKRGTTGRCSRSSCECEREGLGDECIWLVPTDAELQRRTGEPHVDGWPLYSGLPPAAATDAPDALGAPASPSGSPLQPPAAASASILGATARESHWGSDWVDDGV